MMLRDRVLHLLEQNRGQVVTGGELAKLLSVSRTAVWKAIRALRDGGNEIESLSNSGYRLAEESDGLSRQSIVDALRTDYFGREIEVLPTVQSTNQYLNSLDVGSLREGYTVLADEQTEGRGRLGRTFFSPAREGVYFSVLLKPRISLSDIRFVTICAAVAVCRALEVTCGMKPGIKWVNDIYLDGKKLCGILTEAFVSAEMSSIGHVVVGVGLNTGRVAPEVADIATSVYEAAHARGFRNRLTAEILNQFEPIYMGYTLNGNKEEILGAYSERLFVIGRQAEVGEPGASYTASILGVDDCGGLLVEREDGEVFSVRSGEIKLI
ncbi:MAG: biotin--[acetyl-CoA-carboxylase] ligase [Synergistaceae bacterium]|jgi:BirA family biotin operon repressor/biotin-[acetyl-CoA-carboxylase] ligase|nr:biotin--[acetyl-CoA-carboxylase] ligase [Synergistaceae bacterium]